MKRAAALPMVLAVLGLLGALAIAGAYSARRFHADVRAWSPANELRSRTERAAVLAATMPDSIRVAMGVGEIRETSPEAGNLVVTRAWVTRISASSFWVVSESTPQSNSLPVNRLGLLVRYDSGGYGPLVARAWYHLP